MKLTGTLKPPTPPIQALLTHTHWKRMKPNHMGTVLKHTLHPALTGQPNTRLPEHFNQTPPPPPPQPELSSSRLQRGRSMANTAICVFSAGHPPVQHLPTRPPEFSTCNPCLGRLLSASVCLCVTAGRGPRGPRGQDWHGGNSKRAVNKTQLSSERR